MRTLILISVLVLNYQVSAQFVVSNRNTQKVNKEIINYLAKNGELDKNQSSEKLLNQFSVVEILTRKPLDKQDNGVFLFGTLFSPSMTYIVIKDNSKVKILDPYDFSRTINKVLKFLDKQKVNNNNKIKYLKEVIKVYEMNCYNAKYRL